MSPPADDDDGRSVMRRYHLQMYLSLLEMQGIVPRAASVRLDGSDGAAYCRLVDQINKDRCVTRTAAEVLADIEAHPERHVHTFEGLQACCLTGTASADGEPSSVAIDLRVWEAHERKAPPLKLRDPSMSRPANHVGPADAYIKVGETWLKILENSAYGQEHIPRTWAVKTVDGRSFSWFEISRYARAEDLIPLRMELGITGGERE